MASGNFQLALHWSSGGITPYPLYDTWLDDALIAGGQGDFEHLKDPAIDADLAKLNSDQTVAEQTADLAPIEKYVADEPAGHPDHHGGGLVRVHLEALHRLADPDQPLRERPALGHQQRPWHR